MKFCPICKFMLYTKIKPVVSENEESKTEKPILQYYCKNCEWSNNEETVDNNICIYKRNYQEDYIVDRVISNKYTIYDNTLPRVSYDCINSECPTNIELDDNMIMIDNLPPDYDDNKIDELLREDMIRIERGYRVKLTKYVIQVKEREDIGIIIGNYNDKEVNGYRLKIVEYEKPKKEVLYIKYDSINMKYLYICANCGTSWKKN